MITGMGEVISGWLYGGPPDGASSFFAAAGELQNVVGQIVGILDGQQANSAALLDAWASPTGADAVAANVPYAGWLVHQAGQIKAAATQIHTTGAAFDAAKAVTRSPGEFAILNATCLAMMAINPLVLGALTHAIAMNRAVHTAWTHTAVTSYAHYTSASTAMHGAMVPLTAPPSSTVRGEQGAQMLMSSGLGAQAAQGLAASPLSSVGTVGSSVGSAVQPLSSATSLLSQPTSALTSSGSEFAQAPAAASSLSSMPMTSMPMTGSPTAGSGNAGADSGNWWAASGGGGTVAAAFSGGGAGFGGMGGLGSVATLARVQGPGSWGSVNAATPEANQVVMSRLDAVRPASSMPATAGGMGAPGAMPPAARQASSERERGFNEALATAAVLYRPPKDMPVVTGAVGAQFMAREEVL